MEKVLGKIDFAEFGVLKDYPFLIGLQLGFTMGSRKVTDGGKYTENISPECKWGDENRETVITRKIEFINQVLKEAKVSYVSELVGKPVEITLDKNCFHSFRILSEVL